MWNQKVEETRAGLQMKQRGRQIDCIVLTSNISEFTFLRNVFWLAGIRMHRAQAIDQLDYLLSVTESTVLLADVTFAGDTWQSALDFLRQNYPLVPALVIAELADTLLPEDVFRCGGCGIVWRPFRFDDTGALIRAAHSASRERQAWRVELTMAARPAAATETNRGHI